MKYFVEVSVLIVLTISVSGNSPPGHENFWGEPDFFSSLTDYLTAAPYPEAPSRLTASSSELVGRYVPAPVFASTEKSIIHPPVTASYISAPVYQTYHGQEWTDQAPKVVRNELRSEVILQKQSPVIIKPSIEFNPPNYQTLQNILNNIKYDQGQNQQNSLSPNKMNLIKPYPHNHPNSLSITSIEYKKTSSSRRHPHQNKRKRMRTTTPASTTGSTNASRTTSSKNNDYNYDTEDYDEEQIQNPIPTYSQYHGHQHQSVSNAELLPSHQVYESSQTLGVQVPAPSSFQRGQSQIQSQRFPIPKLSPNVIISIPSGQYQSDGVPGEQLAQGSNIFPVVEHEANYVNEENPKGVVGRISDILETGRRILYFPKGVVDVVDQAMTYAETNPYVSYVMDTIADTILGSTKGMSAVPKAVKSTTKPHILIANPNMSTLNPPKS